MNEERLRELRRVVENAPEDRLEMKNFCTKGGCGTAYCAAGWAALDPWFQENTEILNIFDIQVIGNLVYVKEKEDRDAFRGLENMFEIPPQDTTNLFGGNLLRQSDTVPKSLVLANIGLLLDGYPAFPYPNRDSGD